MKPPDGISERARGTNSTANRKEIFIIRAKERSLEGIRADGLTPTSNQQLDPGDVVVVPQKIIGGSLFWRNLLAVGQLVVRWHSQLEWRQRRCSRATTIMQIVTLLIMCFMKILTPQADRFSELQDAPSLRVGRIVQ